MKTPIGNSPNFGKSRLFSALAFVVSLGLIVFLIRRIGWSQFLACFSQMRLRYFLPATALTVPFVGLKAYKWKSLARTAVPNLTFSSALRSFLVGMGVGLLTPSRVGELARVITLKSHKTEGLLLAVIDKLMDVTALAILFLCSLFLLKQSLSRTGCALVFIGVVAFGLFAFSPPFFRFSKRRFLPRRLGQALVHVRKVDRSLLFQNFSTSMGCFFILMLQFHLIVRSFQPISFVAVVIGLPILLVLSSVPISIAGLGIRETVATVIFSRFGVTDEIAATAAFVLFLVNSFTPGLIGLIIAGCFEYRQRRGWFRHES